ncbi:orotidine-5'-phosphate decarboxylase [Helicobacter aurati]|uniref:Orotidine 5'-phosphate decarboxylase n=2 Tax=Helicobacter aurati TaxID=137778 RepID=A0A3D8IZV6_9HELI|nr:orotidine-5'-phosphate decarboxylase [Helicobacter aurati]
MKLCVALDLPSKEQNQNLADEIKIACKNSNISTQNIWLKVGLRSYIRDGGEPLKRLQDEGYKIFLDLKLYDIPNTMLDAIIECEKLAIDMLTIHASCGFKAMCMISEYLRNKQSNLLIVAVSVLTSFDEAGLYEVYGMGIKECVRKLATLAYRSGVDGLVCAINEITVIKEVAPSLLAITPGIRMQSLESMQINSRGINGSKDDQHRIATLQEAKKANSDLVVIGRPIYQASNRIHTLEMILQEIYQ